MTQNTCQVCGEPQTFMQAFFGFEIPKGRTIHRGCYNEYLSRYSSIDLNASAVPIRAVAWLLGWVKRKTIS